MKLSTLTGAMMTIALAAASAGASAADQGNGVITFKGAIIDSPCTIAQESQYQTVEMDQISNVVLKDGGKSRATPFRIELRGCELGTIKSATATFTGSGSTANPQLLAINGTAKGASLAIADNKGDLIKLGDAAPAQQLSNGNTFLQFQAYLQGDMTTPKEGSPVAATIVPGNFETFANFTLAYQ
ncbi:fimbrial protein [Pseudomonas sp. SORT22]|uniref:fimbrial protein n=1 Tax=Pseudomonas sp. SORT22 TaxID=2813842 RepID=UPI001BCFDDE7|nr:fimbrial protein [Pseudomonas sp. SORT22]QVM94314.1 fimbrial protein [Pseudomonas sp. SORT22]